MKMKELDMPQQYAQPGDQTREWHEDAPASLELAQAETHTDALDAVLDDIAGTLETNAQDYVNSFVQQGGE